MEAYGSTHRRLYAQTVLVVALLTTTRAFC